MIIVHRLQACRAATRAGSGPATGALVCALLLAAPGAAAGQRLTGSVADAGTREPIALALVALVDSAGTVLQQVLTNEAGRFILTPRGAGRVRLRIERIGYDTAHEPFFELRPDTERDFAILIAVRPITLEGIAVTDERICSINAAASETLRVWTEARKGLAAARLAEEQRLLRFSGVRFRREVSERGAVVSQTVRPFQDSYRQPFRSLSAADLVERGYVRGGDGINFYAPNADVLLSPEFERANCFSLTRNRAEPDLIGVRFAPNPRHVVPAIAGVVWLDRRTARLRFVEFDYVNTAQFTYAHLASGRVEFRMLPNGGWLVSQWWIRMPSSVQGTGRQTRVVRYVEDGGEVRSAAGGAASWTILAAGAVAGVVFDSTSGQPLRDAAVTLAGTALSARTDVNGRFLIENVPAGTYAVSLSHARLDSLPPYPPDSSRIEVAANDTARATIAIPALERSVLAPCLAGGEADADRVAVYGTVRRQESGEPVGHARVRLSWDSIFRAGRQLVGAVNGVEVETDARGRYSACDVPARMTVHAEVVQRGAVVARMEFHTGTPTARVRGRSIMYQPLVVPRSSPPHAVPPRFGRTPAAAFRRRDPP